MKYTVEVKEVCKSFDKKIVLNNVNLRLEQGKITGIIGRNGSGKTVLLKIICGLYVATSGEVYINGNLLNHEKLDKSIGILIDNGFLADETGYKNLKLLSNLDNSIKEDKILNTMRLVGLDPYNKTKYKNYSTGMKQKLKFAQVLMFDSDILILDELFNGLDKETVKNFRDIIELCKKEGKTILLTSHYQEDIDLLCDKVFEMDMGNLKEVKNYGKE